MRRILIFLLVTASVSQIALIGNAAAESRGGRKGKICLNAATGELSVKRRCPRALLTMDAQSISAMVSAEQGPVGPQGEPGEAGIQGVQGDPGPAGISGYEMRLGNAGWWLTPGTTGAYFARCPEGKLIISGGCSNTNVFLDLIYSRPSDDGSRWECGYRNSTDVDQRSVISPKAICGYVAE